MAIPIDPNQSSLPIQRPLQPTALQRSVANSELEALTPVSDAARSYFLEVRRDIQAIRNLPKREA